MKLEITKEHKDELLQVLTILQPKIGFSGDKIVRAISLYFDKYYKTDLGFTDELGGKFINRDMCTISDGKRTFTVGQVMIELSESGNLIKDRSIQAEDIHGRKMFYYDVNDLSCPRMLSLYKIN